MRVDSPGMNGLRNCTSPKNSCSCIRLCGGFHLWIAVTFSGSGCILCSVKIKPKNLTDLALIWVFFGLNTRPFLCAVSIRLCKLLSCSSSVRPCTVISSAMLMQPLQCSRIMSIHFWNTSCEHTSPNGRQRKWYLPKGLLNIVSMLDFSLSGTH